MGENAEIYERLNRIEQTLARIDERTARQDQSHSDHERRIRDLERGRDRQTGFFAAVASLGGLIGAAATWLIKSFFGGAQ